MSGIKSTDQPHASDSTPDKRLVHSVFNGAWTGKAVIQSILWLTVRPVGNVRGDPLQNEFPDQIPHRALANARQTIEND